MSLQLDARQRAMLQEMGIALPAWPTLAEARPAHSTPHSAADAAAGGMAAPSPAPSAPRSPPPASPVPAPQRPAARPGPAPRPRELPPPDTLAQPPEPRNGPLLARAIAPYAAQTGAAALTGGWLVLLECPQPDDPLAGEAGQLLGNMLQAMGLQQQANTHIAGLLTPAHIRPTPGLTLAETLQQLRPRMLLLLGLGTARAVLGSGQPLAQLRARIQHLADGLPVAVSHDPTYLLRAGQAKAATWQDLCRALAFDRTQDPASGPPMPAPMP